MTPFKTRAHGKFSNSIDNPPIYRRNVSLNGTPQDFNFTLPGFVSMIDPQNPNVIYTSIDLRDYLCVQSQQNSDITKSCTIIIEQENYGMHSILDFDTSFSENNSETLDINQKKKQYFTIISISSHRITVNQSLDCIVNRGEPKMTLRTNLTVHGHEGLRSMKLIDSQTASDVMSSPRILKTFTSNCSFSCIEAHPVFPVVCVGMSDDSVQFLVPDNFPT